MIHSAKFGSIERFIGVLTEHYAGAFPAWLSPEQVTCIPVHTDYDGYLYEVAAKLKAERIRVEVDDSDDRMQKKIRNAQKQKVPFMLIAAPRTSRREPCRSASATAPRTTGSPWTRRSTGSSRRSARVPDQEQQKGRE